MKLLLILSAVMIASVIATDREAHRREMKEKWASMTEAERKEHKIAVREQMKEKFAALSAEKQQAIKEKAEKIFPGAAKAFDETEGDIDAKIEAFYKNITPEDKKKVREHFAAMTPEQRQQFREHAKEFFHKRESRTFNNDLHKTRDEIRRRPDRIRDNTREHHRRESMV
jgi:hypothetical protein